MTISSSILKRVLDLAVTIQQIPAPTFAEKERAGFLLEAFTRENLVDVAVDNLSNVFARFPGSGYRRAVIVSAHTDTVFPQEVDLGLTRQSERITGPGIGDNALGVAGLFGLLWSLRDGLAKGEERLAGDVWLVANTGEEGLGDLRGMQGVVERFGDEPLAYIILEGLSLGQVFHRGLGSRRYRITTRTGGGHAWVDYGRPSAIHVLAELVTQLTALQLPTEPRSSLNVGKINGGISVNTIAAEATLELDLRSENPQVLAGIASCVEDLVRNANREGEQFVGATAEVIGDRPPGEIPADHALVRLAVKCLEAQGYPARLNIGSTDANIPLSRGLPAICLGLSVGGGAHTPEEYILTRPLAGGLAQLVDVVRGVFQHI